MFVKYKSKDNVFKDLYKYQKPLKTLYQQLVIKGYTGTEEEFLQYVYDDIVANLSKQDIKNKFEELEYGGPEEDTLNKLLSYGLVTDALMLDDGNYLEDENGRLLQI